MHRSRRRSRHVWTAACALLAGAASGCGGVSAATLEVDGGDPAGPVGSISAQMGLPAGTLIGSSTYSLKGPNGFARSGSLDVTSSQEVDFGIAQVPAAALGYTLDVVTSSADGSDVCSSSAQFGVDPGATTTVVLVAHCTGTPSPAAQPPAVGTLEVMVEAPSGVSLQSVTFSLMAPTGVPMQDTWSVADDAAILLVIKNADVGNGETLSLNASSTDGGTCTGSSTFDVRQNETTKVTLPLECSTALVVTSAPSNH